MVGVKNAVCVCVYVHVSVLILAVGFKYITNKNTVFLCRGDTFRREFAHLREVNSLIPEGVHTMALTATATRYSRQDLLDFRNEKTSVNRSTTL